MKPRIEFLAVVGAVLLMGCSYVKPMPKALKKSFSAADTIYVLPAQASYSVKGFIFKRSDSSMVAQIRNSADSILSEELARAFPATTIRRIDSDSAFASIGGNSALLTCKVKGFTRTLPREITSEFLNVLFLVPTFALNMGYPIQTTSSVYIEIKKPGERKSVRMKHRDMLASNDREDLHFQIRKILDAGWKG